jgi:transglutaminase-like putative cysteine protease
MPRLRSRATLALPALIAVLARPLHAQSALVLPIERDSIYRLAVDSAAYKEYSVVYLLDDGIARFEADGRGSRRYHQIVQILRPRGVEPWAERAFSYRPGHSKITINWMRVSKTSGELISDKPTMSQVSDVPAAMSNPVYSDTKVLRYSLGGVAVGTIVDISWTEEVLDPFLRGDFLTAWSTTLTSPGLRSRFVLDLPASLSPHIVEQHLDFKRVEETAKGRHYYVWAKQSVLPVKSELFAPDSSVPRMAIAVASAESWTDIARWYGGLSKDRYVLSPRAVATIDSIARAQRTASDTLRALHDWIAKDIRYVSVALGLGGYQPRFPDSTITSGFGDCKDKATLFIAAAHHLGLTAYPVLLASTGVRERTLSSLAQFDHVIAALPKPGNAGYTFLDLTTNLFPPGRVPTSYQGEFGLVVLPDGKSEEITFPTDGPAQTVTTFDGQVGVDGKVAGKLELVVHGGMETPLRAMLMEPLDSARRAALKQSFGQIFPNNTVDSLTTFNGRDPHAEPKITAVVRDGDGFKRVGTIAILTIPSVFRNGGTGLAQRLKQATTAGPRTLPIDASRVLGSSTTSSELRLLLPEGWKAQLPKGVTAPSPFGDYRSEYSQEGRVLRISVRIVGAKGVYPKEKLSELQAWLNALADDNLSSVVVSIPPV